MIRRIMLDDGCEHLDILINDKMDDNFDMWDIFSDLGFAQNLVGG